jgi:hypothetical protein
MQVFDFDPAAYSAQYQQHGWVLIPRGVSRAFFDFGVREADESEALDEFAIKGKKQQARVKLPESVSLDHVFDAICGVTGLNRETIVLSERHLQTYVAQAEPFPSAHKDRRSSQVSVGLTLRTTPPSRLSLWPDEDRSVNEADKATYTSPGELSEPVRLQDHERDVVMFGGSSTWHRREHAAGVTNLYLKFNDFGHDPLGEDPRKLTGTLDQR